MKRHPHDNFLKEILADEALDAVRENSLADGLAAVQSRKRSRMVRTALLAALPLVLLSAVVLRQMPKTSPVTSIVPIAAASHSSSIKIYPAVAAGETPSIPTISDEELLALFKNQSVGLLGTPGQQKLIVFASPKMAMQ